MARPWTPDEIDAAQARIKTSCKVSTVRLMQEETAAELGEKMKVVAQRRKVRPSKPYVYMSEAVVLENCQRILEDHPKVALWWRQNTGGQRLEYKGRSRYVKFSFKGASDLMLVSVRGRFGAVECKAPGKRPTQEQAAFLHNVAKAGGLAVCVDHPGKLAVALATL